MAARQGHKRFSFGVSFLADSFNIVRVVNGHPGKAEARAVFALELLIVLQILERLCCDADDVRGLFAC